MRAACRLRTVGGFISGGSLSGLTGGPLFAVGSTDNETARSRAELTCQVDS